MSIGAMMCRTVALFFLLVAANADATRVPQLPAKALFQATAVIFIGTAYDAPDICKGVNGPCTGIGFSDIEIIVGDTLRSERIAFALPEGVLPDGTSLKIAGAPDFVAGERYLVFVRAGEWHLTPVTNWLHSVFRELPPAGQAPAGPRSLFVNHDGRAVTGLDERGFRLGERIAPSFQLLRRSQPTRGGALSGQVSSRPPEIDEIAKGALLSGDPKTMAGFGMAKDELVETIRRFARDVGVNQLGKIQVHASKSGLYDRQKTPEQTEDGLQPAGPEPHIPVRAMFPKTNRSSDRESAKDTESPQSTKANPGTQVTPDELQRR